MHSSTLLLDVGSQGCRALAVDVEGVVQVQAKRRFATLEDGERAEQDADALAAALVEVAMEVAGALARSGGPVRQAALAVQRGSVVCWDRDSTRALSPVLSWRDRRRLPETADLRGRADEIKRRTGLRFSHYGGASKLAWCLHELPEAAVARDDGRLACGPLGSFLIARLLQGRPCKVDDTLAQRTLLWSRERLDWDPWLLQAFGLPRQPFPQVSPSLDGYGRIAPLSGAPSLGLLMGDQNAVPFVDGRPDPQTLYINLGTGAFLLRPLQPPIDSEIFQLSLLDRTGGGRYAIEASVHGAASALRWLERQNGRDIEHDQFDGLRDRVRHPPLFLNTIDGLGSPWWRPGPEPEFIAGREADGFEVRLLAVLESIAFLIRANIDEMNRRVGPPARVVVSGGLSRSATLCSLMSDLIETDVLRLKSGEGTAMGLWCRLNERALPEDAFECIAAGRDRDLAKRYRQWLERINSN